MTSINCLPNELLIYIFTVGCDELPRDHVLDPSTAEPYPRLKSFMVPVSMVCTNWRNIACDKINSPFWFTCVSFHLSRPERSIRKRKYDALSQLARFRQGLLYSCGCDIVVT